MPYQLTHHEENKKTEKFELGGYPLKKLGEPQDRDVVGWAGPNLVKYSPTGWGVGPTLCVYRIPPAQHKALWMAEFDISGRFVSFTDKMSIGGWSTPIRYIPGKEGIHVKLRDVQQGGFEKLGIPLNEKTKSVNITEVKGFFESLQRGESELPRTIRKYFKKEFLEMELNSEDWNQIREKMVRSGDRMETDVVNALELTYRIVKHYDSMTAAKGWEGDAGKIMASHPDVAPRVSSWTFQKSLREFKNSQQLKI